MKKTLLWLLLVISTLSVSCDKPVSYGDTGAQNPNTHDISTFDSITMQSQEAQHALKENENDVFTIKTDNEMESFLNTTVQLLQKAAPKPHFMTWENLKNTFSSNRDSL